MHNSVLQDQRAQDGMRTWKAMTRVEKEDDIQKIGKTTEGRGRTPDEVEVKRTVQQEGEKGDEGLKTGERVEGSLVGGVYCKDGVMDHGEDAKMNQGFRTALEQLAEDLAIREYITKRINSTVGSQLERVKLSREMEKRAAMVSEDLKEIHEETVKEVRDVSECIQLTIAKLRKVKRKG